MENWQDNQMDTAEFMVLIANFGTQVAYDINRSGLSFDRYTDSDNGNKKGTKVSINPESFTVDNQVKLVQTIFGKDSVDRETLKDIAAFEMRRHLMSLDAGVKPEGNRNEIFRDLESYNRPYCYVDNDVLSNLIGLDSSSDAKELHMLYNDFYLNKEIYSDSWAMLYSDNPPREMEHGPGAPDYRNELDNAEMTLRSDSRDIKKALDRYLEQGNRDRIIYDLSVTETENTALFKEKVNQAVMKIQESFDNFPVDDYAILESVRNNKKEVYIPKVEVDLNPSNYSVGVKIKLLQMISGEHAVDNETIKDLAAFEMRSRLRNVAKIGNEFDKVEYVAKEVVPSVMEIIKNDTSENAEKSKNFFAKYESAKEQGTNSGVGLYGLWIAEEFKNYFEDGDRWKNIIEDSTIENTPRTQSFNEKASNMSADIQNTFNNILDKRYSWLDAVILTAKTKGVEEGKTLMAKEVSKQVSIDLFNGGKQPEKEFVDSIPENTIIRIMKAANVNWGKDKDGNPIIPTPEQVGQRFAFHRNNSQNATELQKSVDTLREQQNSFIGRLQSSLRKMLPASLYNTLSALDRQIHSPYSSTTLHPQVERNLAEVVNGMSSEQRKETAEGIVETERLLLGDWKQGHEKLDRLSSVLVEKSQEVQSEEQEQGRGLHI